MKKIVAVILLSVLAVASLTACGSKEQKADANNEVSAATETVKKAESSSITKETLVGTWELTNARSRKDGSYSELASTIQESFVFTEDGKYSADGTMFTQSGTYSFDENNNLITIQDGYSGQKIWSYDAEKAELSYQASGDDDYIFKKK